MQNVTGLLSQPMGVFDFMRMYFAWADAVAGGELCMGSY